MDDEMALEEEEDRGSHVSLKDEDFLDDLEILDSDYEEEEIEPPVTSPPPLLLPVSSDPPKVQRHQEVKISFLEPSWRILVRDNPCPYDLNIFWRIFLHLIT